MEPIDRNNHIDEIEERFMQLETDQQEPEPETKITTTSASGTVWIDSHPKMTEEEADKALKNLKKREKKYKFRQINDIRKLRIGDKVRSRNGFPMVVTGIFQDCLTDYLNGTLYLDFAENEGDIWEEDLGDVEWDGSWLSVLWKKITR